MADAAGKTVYSQIASTLNLMKSTNQKLPASITLHPDDMDSLLEYLSPGLVKDNSYDSNVPVGAAGILWNVPVYTNRQVERGVGLHS